MGLAALVLALDQASKAWAFDTLRLHGPVLVVPGWLQFEFAFNPGSAFGMFAGADSARPFLIAATLAVLVYLATMAWRVAPRHRLAFAGIGLAAGGAVGNLCDRLLRELPVWGRGLQHGVVDFIVVFYAPGRRWPAFNLADVALLLGVLAFATVLLRHGSAGMHGQQPRSQ